MVAVCGSLFFLNRTADLSSDEAKVAYDEGYEWGERYPKNKFTDDEFRIRLKKKVDTYGSAISQVPNADDKSLLRRVTAGWEQGTNDARNGRARQVGRDEAREAGRRFSRKLRGR